MRWGTLALAMLATASATAGTREAATAATREAPTAGTEKAGAAGYGAKVDALAVTGPPPAPGSAAAAADSAAIARTYAGINGPAWQQGKAQLSLRSKPSMRILGCALGRIISPQATPATARLLARIQADVSGPINKAKLHYHRDRPFVGDPNQQTCDPRTRDKARLGSDEVQGYSYPSGHAAYGRIAAQVLAQVEPGRAGALKMWGESLGDNRVACRLHWPSDVAAGRRLADAVHAQVRDNPALRKDVAAARAEMETAPLAIAC